MHGQFGSQTSTTSRAQSHAGSSLIGMRNSGALLAMPIPDTIEEALAEVIATAQPNMEAIEELRAAIVRETEELQRDNTKH